MEAAANPRRRFLDLIDAVAGGRIEPQDALTKFQPVLEDSYCVDNLHAEFNAAFAHQPQRDARTGGRC